MGVRTSRVLEHSSDAVPRFAHNPRSGPTRLRSSPMRWRGRKSMSWLLAHRSMVSSRARLCAWYGLRSAARVATTSRSRSTVTGWPLAQRRHVSQGVDSSFRSTDLVGTQWLRWQCGGAGRPGVGLARRLPGYSSRSLPMSVVGCARGSPPRVRRVFRRWRLRCGRDGGGAEALWRVDVVASTRSPRARSTRRMAASRASRSAAVALSTSPDRLLGCSQRRREAVRARRRRRRGRPRRRQDRPAFVAQRLEPVRDRADALPMRQIELRVHGHASVRRECGVG